MASLDDMNNGHRLLTVLWLSAAALAPDLKHPSCVPQFKIRSVKIRG